MTVRELLVHCNGLVALAGTNAINENVSTPEQDIQQVNTAVEVAIGVLAAVERLIVAVESKGLLLPLKEDAQAGERSGPSCWTSSLFPRLFARENRI